MSIDDIEVLEGVEAIRCRPTMYVGDLRSPDLPVRLLEEAMCECLSQIIDGDASKVTIEILDPRRVACTDDGPGLPVERQSEGKHWVETVMTVLFACRAAKKSKERGDQLCALGLAVVNALSVTASISIARNGSHWSQSYSKGRPTTPFQRIGDTAAHGTRLEFELDEEILPGCTFDVDAVRSWATTLAAEFECLVEVVVAPTEEAG